jgi:hypothetical protein
MNNYSRMLRVCVAAAMSTSLAVAAPAIAKSKPAHTQTRSRFGVALASSRSPVKAPTVTTGGVSAITSSGATLAGVITPNGTSASYYFRYVTIRGQIVQAPSALAGSTSSPTAAQTVLTGLSPATSYRYQLMSTSAAGTVGGAILTFNTSSSPIGSGTPPTQLETTPQTTWAPVGSLPLSDSQAAALVTPEPEVRPGNAAANDFVPTSAQLAEFYQSTPGFLNDPLRQYVTGQPGIPNPSTDDLIQWAAHKWGIPENWIRAEMVVESDWNQGMRGDLTNVVPSWYGLYPQQSQVPSSSNVYQSLGVMQVRWLGDNTGVGAGTEPLRWESTAFNLDFYASTVRWLYDGYTANLPWIPNIYKGSTWNSIGGWYGGGGNAAAQKYVAQVQRVLGQSTWTQPGF